MTRGGNEIDSSWFRVRLASLVLVVMASLPSTATAAGRVVLCEEFTAIG